MELTTALEREIERYEREIADRAAQIFHLNQSIREDKQTLRNAKANQEADQGRLTRLQERTR